ncbi:MAG TPA: hypothetical protein VG454_03830 [Gemmatimonadales bacterium]|nr:hypothetical protein [Gemmatimonadales bacterium]
MFYSMVGMSLLVALAQVPDRQKTCADLEARAFTVGTWMTHDWTGGQMNGSKTRVAVVRKESLDQTPYYWYELTMDDPARPAAKMAFQIQVGGPESNFTGVRTVIMKAGDMPPMRMPPETMQMFKGINVAQMARECQTMDAVAWEDLSVPAGKFHTLHLRNPRTALEFWITAGPRSGIVKLKSNDGSIGVLSAQGDDAKSSFQ